MTIMPKRGYRVCLECGKIFLSKRLVSNKQNNKNVKCCPYCGCNEKEKMGNEVLNEVNAKDLFYIVGLKSKEFCMSPEIEAKYDKMYDNCLIPKSVRV